MNRLRAQQGLTLVELLLGLAITAILMAPLAAMFQSASGSSIATQAALDLNGDARFALERIARSATAALTKGPGIDPANVNTWLSPLSYNLVNGNLVETDTSLKPTRTSVIAANVSAFQLSAPATSSTTSQTLLKIDLTLEAQGSSVSASRIVRIGGPQ